MVIDAHLHLWNRQHGIVNGKAVKSIGGGRSDFGGEIRQMMPPYMTDGKNTVEKLIANMDYAGVAGCVITQEYIDGNQNTYLLKCREKYPDRIKICYLYDEKTVNEDNIKDYDGIKVCAQRLQIQDLRRHKDVFALASETNKFISIDLADGNSQVPDMEEMICMYPDLRIAIGHFGMVTIPKWQEQIALAKHKNVYIESGGITWLFHEEFYPYPSAVDAIKEAAQICGMNKLMWGSDYPRTMTAITYLMSLDFIVKSEKLSEPEKAMFLGGNAKDFYGFQYIEMPDRIKNMVE